MLWWSGLPRGPWMLLFPVAPVGPAGLLLCATGFAGLLGFAAVHNTALATYRQLETPDEVMARAATAWSAAIRLGQPLFVLGGGLVATWLGIRAGLWLGTALLGFAALPLPRPARASSVDSAHPRPVP